MPYEFITTLLDFKGFQVADLQIEGGAAHRMVVILDGLEGTHRSLLVRENGSSGI